MALITERTEDVGPPGSRRVERQGSWRWVTPPALLALVLSVAWSWRPSYWVDETATLSATTRPVDTLPHLLVHQDVVHGFYYLLLSPWAHLSTDAWWTRFPSALAAAAAAALIAVLGWQLRDRRAGLAAGLVFALVPLTSQNGAQARSTMLATAVVAGAAVALVEATRRGTHRSWALYGLLVALCGWVFVFSLLVVIPFAVLVGLTRRPPVVRFLVSSAAAGLLALPVVVLGSRETGQISWMGPMTWDTVRGAWQSWTPGAGALGLVLWLGTAAGVVTGVASARRGRTGVDAVLFPAALAVLPVATLLTVSFLRPAWAPRYVFFSIIGLSLLVGRVLAGVRPRWLLPVGLVVLLVLGLPQQRAQRRVTGFGDSQSRLADVLSAQKRPGDAVVFTRAPWRGSAAAYPEAFAGLDDVGLDRSPVATGTFTGSRVPSAELVDRAGSVSRVWWWHETRNRPTDADRADIAALTAAGWTLTQRHGDQGTSLDLLTR